MPSVNKQSATNNRVSSGVAARIKPVQADNDGLRLSVYGRGKTGKTRFACTFPKPLLLIGTEKGTKSVAGVKGVDFLRLQSTQDIKDLLPYFKGGKYKTGVIDHASGLQDVVLKEILGLDDVPIQKTWGIAKQQDWGTCNIQTKEHLLSLLSLSESHGTNIVVIAHERNFNDDASGDNDLIQPTVGSALTPGVAGWLNGACDYICQTYIREQTVRSGTDVIMETKTGKKEYCLRVGPHPVFQTGFRLPPGIELPDTIVDPTYSKIIKLIQGQPVK